MDKEILINKKIAKIDNLIKKSKRNKGIMKGITTTLGFFFLGFGMSMLFTTPLVTLAILPLLTLVNMARGMIEIVTNNSVKCLEKQKEHLESVQTKELNDSEDLIAKRKKKITMLQKSKENLKKSSRIRKIFQALLIIPTAGGMFMTISSPLYTLLSFAGVLGTKAANDIAEKEFMQRNILDTRIANLKNDLEIISVEKRMKNRKRASLPEQSDFEERTQAKAKEDNRIAQPSHIIKNNSIRENEEELNKYIRSLERQQEVESKKQYKKSK